MFYHPLRGIHWPWQQGNKRDTNIKIADKLTTGQLMENPDLSVALVTLDTYKSVTGPCSNALL